MKADVNATNSKGLSPLDLANKASSWASRTPAALFLVTAAQDLSVPKNWGGKGNENCLHRAAHRGMSDSWVVLEYLWS